jgi:uncharacterized protein YndB with AHSA1/START domain
MTELSISRLIAAPPEIVWDAMVNRFAEWWCPAPWRAEIVRWDRRPGGRADSVMFGPDGETVPQNGIFLDWQEGRRFAMTDAINGDLEPAGPFMIGIWEIEAEGGQTRYTARARHWTEEAKAQHEAMGFEQGWTAAAAQLAGLCEG